MLAQVELSTPSSKRCGAQRAIGHMLVLAGLEPCSFEQSLQLRSSAFRIRSKRGSLTLGLYSLE